MALILKRFYQGYFYVFNDLADPDVADSPIGSPFTLLAFLCTYVFIVKKLGPQLMEKRQPYDIKKIIIIYNVIQIFINFKIMYEAILLYSQSPSRVCIRLSKRHPLYQSLVMQYLALKVADCIETVFFVLKKSYRQISFLHVYHHCGMVLAIWMAYKFALGPNLVYVGLVNAFVHGVMFIYYLLSTIDPSWKKNLTAKKILTQIQLIQFIFFIITYTIISLDATCDFPKPMGYLWVTQNVFMFALFAEFYVKTYWIKPAEKKN